ncbi:MAG: GtrA family protein [Clostridia bacterium]|nr:GtrA family protein [Clostridia bacterium]
MKKLLSLFDVKLLKFLLVGVLNTLLGDGLSFLLINLTDLNMWLATALPTVIASVMSYFLNKYFTFKNTEKGWRPALRFALNIAVCYLLAYGIAIPLMQFALSTAEPTLRDNLSKLIGMCLFVGFNYLGQRLFAFRTKES